MILITGATGFIGNFLYQKINYLNISINVTIRSVESARFFKNPIVVGEIDEKTDWSIALSGIDTVVHLAARVHVMREKSHDSLAEFRLLNVAATINLARQAANMGVKRFIFLSSIKVNGELTQLGQKYKADDIPDPEDAYAISKWEAEQALFKIAGETGMKVVIIRSPLVYGSGVKANFLSLMNLVRKGIPLPLAAVTDNRRSLVAVDNLVDFIITCISHPAAANQVFLVSDDEDLSTAELLHRMYQANGSFDSLFSVPLNVIKICSTVMGKKNFYQRLCGSLQVDISKSKQLLGWKPPISVDEGLRRAFGKN
jgi:nucleoside-diphosphate-sugar epimerase